MNTKNLIGFFVAILAILSVMPLVNAQALSSFARIQYIEVNDLIISQIDQHVSVEAGENLDILVVFDTVTAMDDVRVVARVLGEPGLQDSTPEFDVVADRYTKRLSIALPDDVDTRERFTLAITVEGNSGLGALFHVFLEVQRANDRLQIVSVDSDSRVAAGETLALDVVVANMGRDEAEETFVEARIAELGISKRIFLEDIVADDDADNFGTSNNDDDEDDSAAGRILLNIPTDAPAGLYNIEVRAFNDESQTSVTRRVEVIGGGYGQVFSSTSSESFSVGAEGKYSITLVNGRNRIMVYTLVPETDDSLDIDLDETVVAVPAGSSRTVDFTAKADREGTYDFKVNVHNADGAQIASQSYTADVEGRAVGGNTAVVLTIVLAIIFVVLLVVLIVLLTRKPEKTEEFGESYY